MIQNVDSIVKCPGDDHSSVLIEGVNDGDSFDADFSRLASD